MNKEMTNARDTPLFNNIKKAIFIQWTVLAGMLLAPMLHKFFTQPCHFC
jgi:hypothetical protein